MSNTIQIKSGSSVPSATTLAPFELGFSTSNNKLYIGRDGNPPLVLNPDVNLKSNYVIGILPIDKGGTGKTSRGAALAALSGGMTFSGDLNTLTEPGIYWCILSDCQNGPDGITVGGYLERISHIATGTSNEGIQRWTHYSGFPVYARVYSDNQWHDWIEESTTIVKSVVPPT